MRRLLTMTALAAAALPLRAFEAAGAQNERMEISRSASRPTAQGPSDTFTGHVSVTPLFAANDDRDFSSGRVTFTPCARSAWHTHPAGQTLIVTDGTGWVQEWGRPKRQLNAGDVVWTPPGVKHWHGASESAALTHIAIQAHRDGIGVDWLEHVTDEQYAN